MGLRVRSCCPPTVAQSIRSRKEERSERNHSLHPGEGDAHAGRGLGADRSEFGQCRRDLPDQSSDNGGDQVGGRAEVLDLKAHVSVPFVSSHHALKTKEWTPLEPGVIDHKFYVRGIGDVREVTVKGGIERLKLIKFHKG